MRRKRSKKMMFNKKYIFIILGIILIIVVSVLCFLLIGNNKNERNLIYDDFDPIISKIDDNIYYMFGVNSNISFEITKGDNFSYEIVDKREESVSVNILEDENIVTIKAPSDLYIEGEVYTLKINNGTFNDERIKDAKQIIFNIKRAASQSSLLKESVKSINKDSITIDKDTLKTNQKLVKDDIVIVFNNDKIDSFYKVDSELENNEYKVSIPKLNEVFSEFDYYGMERINLGSFENNNDVNSFLVGVIKRSIYNSLIDTVYADKNIKIDGPSWNKKDKKLSYKITIDSNEGSSIFDKDFLKYHKSKIQFDLNINANLYRNISFDNYDVALIIDMEIENYMNLVNIDNRFNELSDAINGNNKEYDATWLKDDYDNINSDYIEFDKGIGSVLLDTKVPGLYVKLDTGILLNASIKANTNGNVSQTIKIIGGAHSGVGTYGNYIISSDGDITSLGSGNTKIGNYLNFEINFMNINNLKLNTRFGLNTNGNVNIKIDKSDDKITTNLENNASINSFGWYKIYNNINDNVVDKIILDDSYNVGTYEKKMDFVKKVEDKALENTLKYTASEIKDKLKTSYDELDSVKTWDMTGESVTVSYYMKKNIDVDKNTLTASWNYDDKITYSCVYNYLNDTIDCDNFSQTQAYVKGICDDFYNDYLIYEQTGESDNEYAEEWEFLYGDLDQCYYELISREEPKDFKSDFYKILDGASLTFEELDVLK